MFRIVCDPSSRSTELCLTEITLSGTQIFFVCLVGVWQRNFEPAVCVCVHGTCKHTPQETIIKNLHETYQCRMYSRKLSILGREDARTIERFITE